MVTPNVTEKEIARITTLKKAADDIARAVTSTINLRHIQEENGKHDSH